MTIITGYFNDCRSLEEVRLPRKCIAVNNSFQSSSIKKMEFGQVREIYNSFRSCPQLKSVGEISANYINNSFIDCSVIDSITISNQVTEIYGYSFQNCLSLRYLRLPEWERFWIVIRWKKLLFCRGKCQLWRLREMHFPVLAIIRGGIVYYMCRSVIGENILRHGLSTEWWRWTIRPR